MNANTRIWVADAKHRLGYVRAVIGAIQADWILDVFGGDVDSIPKDIDLVLISDERTANWLGRLLPQIREHRVPILHLADGICDWKNIFENPLYDRPNAPGLPLYQPILADKIACVGKSQVRLLDAFGNIGKTELVGMPRLDEFLPARSPSHFKKDGQIRLCITTARTPFFNETQKKYVLESLLNLKDALDGVESLQPKRFNIIWRLPESLSAPLHIKTSQTDTSGRELKEILKSTDVFISTPSTTVLEAMLAGIPTAVLEYNPNPVFVGAAWEIRSQNDLPRVLKELQDPPPERLWFQDYSLHDHLECRTPAMPRLRQLIEYMVVARRKAVEHNAPLELPPRIIEDEHHGHHAVPEGYRLRDIYPNLNVWQSDLDIPLQLAHIKRENAALRDLLETRQREINRLNRFSVVERFFIARARQLRAKLRTARQN